MPRREKIILEILSGNAGGVMEGILSVDVKEKEHIYVKGGAVIMEFPGVTISTPLCFCDEIRAVIDAAKANK
jgi:hypothetical protein